MTGDGTCALGGLVTHLGDLTAVLASSPLSGMRLQPNTWSGAYICWGHENREAAVRFCSESSGNPHGANIEVKVVDGSANPYLATATILAAAHAGIIDQTPLPREVTVNPSILVESERGERVPTEIGAILRRLRASGVARSALGNPIIEAMVAVKELEHSRCAELDASAVVERLRYAWSV